MMCESKFSGKKKRKKENLSKMFRFEEISAEARKTQLQREHFSEEKPGPLTQTE